MKPSLRALTAAALVLATLNTTAATGPAADRQTDSARVIVKFRGDAATVRRHAMAVRQPAATVARLAQQRADALASGAGVPLVAGRMVNWHSQVVTARGLDSATLAARLARHPEVEYAVVDQRRRATAVPTDPFYAAGPATGPAVGQWYLRAPDATVRSSINAPAAWDRVTGSSSVVVAVIDTGVRFDHPDLDGVLLPGIDMIHNADVANDGQRRATNADPADSRDDDASDPGDWITPTENGQPGGVFEGCGAQDSSWHGTQVSGIIGAAANNGLGMAGTAFGVRILPVRVLGKCGGFDSDILAGVYWAAGVDQPGQPGSGTPARVLNLSLGGEGACSQPYIDAVNAVGAAPHRALLVVAAGNSNGHAVSAPANCPGVAAVLGLRHAGTKVGFSDLGPEITISAPGGNCINIGINEPCLYPILTSTNSGTRGPNAGGSTWTDSFNFSVGTSFSAPIVSGTAALMLSARPGLTPAEMIGVMRSTARAFPTSGADNGDGTTVPQCRQPDAVPQDQCYCTTAVCGAGMLDAGGAVAAVVQTQPRITTLTASPQAGGTVQLSAADSLLGSGRRVVGYQWDLVNSGGATTGFSSATNASTVSFSATAAGTVVVRLTLTDDLGGVSATEASIVVAAAATGGTPPPSTGGGASSGGGGGATSPLWLLLLAAATLALGRRRR